MENKAIHSFLTAAFNFLLVMAIFSLSRVFFFLVNSDLYLGIAFSHVWEMLLGGMRFDLTALLYLNCIAIGLTLLPLPAQWKAKPAYRLTVRLFHLVPNALAILVNCADMVYIRFSDRRTTCTVFSEFGNDSNLGSIFLQSTIQYWYVTLFALAMLVILFVSYIPIPKQTASSQRPSLLRYYLSHTIIFLTTIFFMVIGIRGGFGKYTRPITISNAMQYVDHPSETAIVLNTPFTLMMSMGKEAYANPQYFSPQEMEAIMSPVHIPAPSVSERHNVCILILESFSMEHIGFYNHHLDDGTYQGYTPFLDSLLAESVTFRHSYASGRKSIDAMPSILSSIPMLIESYIVTPYATNEVSSIADVLTNSPAASSLPPVDHLPYSTAFFHGAPNGSMGFQAFARSAHFQRYFGMSEYEAAHPDANAFDGTWAIWDEEFLQFFAETMSTMQEPFCTSVFTASSHHPFHVPNQYKDTFPDGPKPLCKCIAYSDHALRRFFQTASRQPWFSNTLFVLTADHTNQPYHDEYLTDEGLYRVPIAFYAPWLTPRYDTTTVISQIDIMPSILAELGCTQPFFAFGQDALTQPKEHNYAVCYNHPFFQIISRNGMLQFDGNNHISYTTHAPTSLTPCEHTSLTPCDSTSLTSCERTSLTSCDSTSLTPCERTSLTPCERTSLTPDLSNEEAADMLTYLKAMIQQYICRMADNKLTIQ